MSAATHCCREGLEITELMPRIRTLKPEHRQHRKVGMLSDRQYRLWVGMLTEADDDGRLVAHAEQLRALVFPYFRSVSAEDIEAALQAIVKLGLVRLYEVRGTRYAVFDSWHEHQRINRPLPSKLPTPPTLTEDSLSPQSGSDQGSRSGSRSGEDGKGEEREERGTEPYDPSNRTASTNGLGRQPVPPAPGTYDDILERLRREKPGARGSELEAEALRQLNGLIRPSVMSP
jgi:hypothetical protein